MPDFLDTVDQSVLRAISHGVAHCRAQDERFDGRTVRVADRELVQFASCSYLGLELDERLKQGAIEAVDRYGTCVSSSRSYLGAPLIEELEDLLHGIFGAPALLTATTTLAHLSALPVLIGKRDAVLLDYQVHASVQTAVAQLRARRTHVETLPHNQLEPLAERIAALESEYERIWYCADGVYSMYADLCPVPELLALQEQHPSLHFYFDDAHGMSWTGAQGRGHVLGSRPVPERTVVAVSLAKGFGSGGGAALVTRDADTLGRICRTGGPMIYSGPVPPAVLGAAIASARIHLSPEIDTLQAELRERIVLFNRLLMEAGLAPAAPTEVPIRFVPFGPEEMTCALTARVQDDGFFTNPGVLPAVAIGYGGIRLTLTRHVQEGDVRGLVASLERHGHELAREHGVDLARVHEHFGLPAPESRETAA